MSEGSKSGNAAQAFQRHFDQDRSAHASQHSQHMGGPPDSFRNAQNSAAQQSLANQQYAREQMARMHLEDFDGSASPAFMAGHHGPAMNSPVHQSFIPGPNTHHAVSAGSDQQNTSAHLLTASDPLLFTEEFNRMQLTDQSRAVAGPSTAAPSMHTANAQVVGRHYNGSPFDAQAFAPPLTYQPGFMPGRMNYSPALVGGSSSAQVNAQSSNAANAEKQHDHKEIAAAWEASFEEAMNEWVATQNDLEAVAGMQAAEAAEAEMAIKAAEEDTQDRPLNSSELARAAQQLVDAVSDNNSEKFRKSNFVDLMRRIAAQEIVVENNSLVEANTTATDFESLFGGSTTAKDKGKGKAVAKQAYVEDGDSL